VWETGLSAIQDFVPQKCGGSLRDDRSIFWKQIFDGKGFPTIIAVEEIFYDEKGLPYLPWAFIPTAFRRPFLIDSWRYLYLKLSFGVDFDDGYG